MRSDDRHDLDDRDLAARFAELRRADAADVPRFDETVAAARRRASAPQRIGPVRIAAVAAALLFAVGMRWLVLRVNDTLAARRASVVVPLSQWRSPTAFLLHGPGDALITTVPVITASPPELERLRRARPHPGES